MRPQIMDVTIWAERPKDICEKHLNKIDEEHPSLPSPPRFRLNWIICGHRMIGREAAIANQRLQN